MTEQEWLTSEDPQAMLRRLGEPGSVSGSDPEGRAYRRRITDRKLRLFACAAARQVWHLLTDRRSRNAVEVAERFADGLATAEDMKNAHADAYYDDVSPEFTSEMAWATCSRGVVQVERHLLRWFSVSTRLAAEQAALLRDIIGNSWRAVRLPWEWKGVTHHSPEAFERLVREGKLLCPWLTPTVLAVARATYDERPGRECARCKGRGEIRDVSFEINDTCGSCHGVGRIADGTLDPTNLLVLADALEDAGCDAGELLGHLRSPGPHVRGCWAVDLVLGKE